MCACDLNYTCPACARFEKWEPDDREHEEEARYASESPSNGPEAVRLVSRP